MCVFILESGSIVLARTRCHLVPDNSRLSSVCDLFMSVYNLESPLFGDLSFVDR